MKRFELVIMLLVLPLVGCSTWVNDTAPARDPGQIYAVGARQKFLCTRSAVWLCPSEPSSSSSGCKRVSVDVAKE